MKKEKLVGQLRHRVELQSPDSNEDGSGGRDLKYSTKDTVWASVETKTGTERFQGNGLTTKWDVRVIIRYYPGIRENWNVKFGTRNLRVVSFRTLPDGEPIWSEVYCLEDVPR